MPARFTVGISTKPEILANAAERLLGSDDATITAQAQDIIFGQLRQVIATMDIEEINANRDRFIDAVSKSVDTELHKIGLSVINVNITDITDESGYIEAIGKKAAAEAIQKAKIDVAAQERDGTIGVETANREKAIQVANQQAQTAVGQKEADRDQRVRTNAYEAEAVEGENKAKMAIAATNADLAEKQAEARKRGDVAKANADKLVLEAQKEAEIAKLRMTQLAQEEVNKQKAEVMADAEAERKRRIAKGEADAVLAKYEAEAKGIEKTLLAKAEGYKKLAEAAGGADRMASLLMIENFEELARINADAIKNIKIGEITVWDGGRGSGEVGATAGFLRDFASMLPPIQHLAKQAGIKLPEYLGSVDEKVNGSKPLPQ